MALPKRKKIRLKNFDYSSAGAYFVTVCTRDRAPLLGEINVGRNEGIPPTVLLSHIGEIVDEHIKRIDSVYCGVSVDKYVIMPDHIHMLISISDGGGMRASRPTVNTVVRSLKTMVTRRIGRSVWQDSFYERIKRNENDYSETWQYIDGNPRK